MFYVVSEIMKRSFYLFGDITKSIVFIVKAEFTKSRFYLNLPDQVFIFVVK